jgi:hypothetical protein
MIEPAALRDLLLRVPGAQVPPSAAIAGAVERSVAYLDSDAAFASVDADPYWPKWDSPWWHMLLLDELGEARRIPGRIVARMIARVDAMPYHIFPVPPDDVAPGTDLHRDTSCHCALGNLGRMLSACGVAVERALPWVEPWFFRYQMADGGLNCDGDAYLQRDECPSSMVGTIGPFEAMLVGGPGRWSPARRAFLERGAAFLVERRLMLGSTTRHNADERAKQGRWLELCWPRFYFYDVLRGLSALVRWSELGGRAIPVEAVAPVVQHLVARFPDGVVRLGRDAVRDVTTVARAADGTQTREPASRFPLLDATSAVGQPSAAATRAWTAARQGLVRLLEGGLLVA